MLRVTWPWLNKDGDEVCRELGDKSYNEVLTEWKQFIEQRRNQVSSTVRLYVFLSSSVEDSSESSSPVSSPRTSATQTTSEISESLSENSMELSLPLSDDDSENTNDDSSEESSLGNVPLNNRLSAAQNNQILNGIQQLTPRANGKVSDQFFGVRHQEKPKMKRSKSIPLFVRKC